MGRGIPEMLNSHHMTQKFHSYISSKLKNAGSHRDLYTMLQYQILNSPHGNNPNTINPSMDKVGFLCLGEYSV